MIMLIPENHFDSVRFFADFFKLKINQPDLPALKIILAHFSTIPYENISKIIKLSQHWNSENKLRLPDEVMNDHARFHLGGTCFSLTFFLETILLHFGYHCYPVMGDMKAGENIHCAVIVLLDGKKYLVDPGYLLNEPMEINPQQPRLFRSARVGVELLFNPALDKYQLFTFNQEKKIWRYNFSDQACSRENFLLHWQNSFTKVSMHGICLTKLQKDGLIYIHKDFMRETTFAHKKNYNLKNNLHQTIQAVFGISQQQVEQAQAALEFNLAMEKKLGLFVPRSHRT